MPPKSVFEGEEGPTNFRKKSVYRHTILMFRQFIDQAKRSPGPDSTAGTLSRKTQNQFDAIGTLIRLNDCTNLRQGEVGHIYAVDGNPGNDCAIAEIR